MILKQTISEYDMMLTESVCLLQDSVLFDGDGTERFGSGESSVANKHSDEF